ncbi:hypothetical protein BLA60_38500 [Actinophytocola xinjiangensis]|uniref:Uncharacterized protein n=1 Tax=Actinophytocola xinjiangensis TaxID=485602 RepID=A0A7Z0WGQ4_9PSEU|nr:hypothetical protein [Actinophytocola xinjiangensis]OLF04983.1 hypothetical protein BLA60_38500 [Actinophytocola xinjiangensis]
MDERLYRLLAEGVGRYLESVDRLAGARPEGALGVETRRLVAAWRALLELHRQVDGRCVAGCPSRRLCAAWRVAGAYFVRRVSSRRRAR